MRVPTAVCSGVEWSGVAVHCELLVRRGNSHVRVRTVWPLRAFERLCSPLAHSSLSALPTHPVLVVARGRSARAAFRRAEPSVRRYECYTATLVAVALPYFSSHRHISSHYRSRIGASSRDS